MLCVGCFGLMPPLKKEVVQGRSHLVNAFLCPTCGIRYEHDPSRTYLDENGLRRYLGLMSGWGEGSYLVEFKKPLEHCRDLAFIGAQLEAGGDYWTPLKCLFASLEKAERFVHFVSFSIDIAMCGALAVLAERVDVRGIVGVANESVEDEIKRLKLRVNIYGKNRWGDVPHQKLIVVDGVLAFKGSANLSTQAWHKAGKAKQELVESVTDLSAVVGLDNTYFARLWAQVKPPVAKVNIGDDIPF